MARSQRIAGLLLHRHEVLDNEEPRYSTAVTSRARILTVHYDMLSPFLVRSADSNCRSLVGFVLCSLRDVSMTLWKPLS